MRVSVQAYIYVFICAFCVFLCVYVQREQHDLSSTDFVTKTEFYNRLLIYKKKSSMQPHVFDARADKVIRAQNFRHDSQKVFIALLVTGRSNNFFMCSFNVKKKDNCLSISVRPGMMRGRERMWCASFLSLCMSSPSSVRVNNNNNNKVGRHGKFLSHGRQQGWFSRITNRIMEV